MKSYPSNTLLSSYLLLFFIGITLHSPLKAQEGFPYNGINTKAEPTYALVGAKIHASKIIEGKALLIKGNRIIGYADTNKLPEGGIVIDLQGKHIYPSFIDLHSTYGQPEPKKKSRPWHKEQYLSDKEGPYNWNQAIHPETNAFAEFTHKESDAEEYRKAGFGAVLSHSGDGIARGTGALIALDNQRPHLSILKPKAGHFLSFTKGSSSQNYPASLMGAISLLKQTYYDAAWYEKNKPAEFHASLDAWNANKSLPQFFDTEEAMDIMKADKVGDAFGHQYIFFGNGDEYQKLNEVKKTGGTVILPLKFPKPFIIENPLLADFVSLSQMKHWEHAPRNAKYLNDADVPFALTSAGLSKANFLKQLRWTVAAGLDTAAALAALTTTPAKLLGMEGQIGTLQTRAIANILISSGDLFDGKSAIVEHWVNGKRFVISSTANDVYTRTYQVTFGKQSFTMDASFASGKLTLALTSDTALYTITKSATKGNSITFQVKDSSDNTFIFGGFLSEREWSGQLTRNDTPYPQAWYAQKTTAAASAKGDRKDSTPKENEGEDAIEVFSSILSPFSPYGFATLPTQDDVVFRNATVWTNEKEGILPETDVIVKAGKIVKIGKDLNCKACKEIDATGKHLTSGIIDEHAHIAISRGVNEISTQSVTAEVSVADAINAADINIYRALAGGVTSAQLLHGSANTIGGQSAIVKWRWGKDADGLIFQEAAPFIKCALGENVKRSYRGTMGNNRYPDTRMGVEQVFADAFNEALIYRKNKEANPDTYRYDLEKEVLLEIIEGRRFISCHSYVQSEILMLMDIAEKYGFTINTFTHVLEGYKVSKEMKEHGAGGSTFSDWWAYKWEVNDAIPYNAAMMVEAGVVTAINSDDPEMGRRLNQEAAKAVKYGGVSEEEAWKLVTLNPAKLLHLDKYTGSIKAGKDADLVLWSANPLSIYAIAEKTMVDGAFYFEMERDIALRVEIAQERQRLMQKMKNSINGGAKGTKPQPKHQHKWHCDDVLGEHHH